MEVTKKMVKQSTKRNIAKFTLLGLSVATFSMTAGILSGILATPIPLVSGFTLKDALALLGVFGYYMMETKQV